MATFTASNPFSGESTEVTKLDLSDGPHDFTFRNRNQALVIENGESSASIVTTLSGDGVTTFVCPGAGTIDLSGGFAATTASGVTEAISSTEIRHYLGANGNAVTVTITGATSGNSFGYLIEG